MDDFTILDPVFEFLEGKALNNGFTTFDDINVRYLRTGRRGLLCIKDCLPAKCLIARSVIIDGQFTEKRRPSVRLQPFQTLSQELQEVFEHTSTRFPDLIVISTTTLADHRAVQGWPAVDWPDLLNGKSGVHL